ncbi:MAG: N-acetyl-gamma-glutamyl-phosphate reductase [Spirochaetaceae bacterium]|nr:MAG: N-acetyl-gamma-glutamyl-phosphate reductase [Spirochaetaceae bacterium]
MKAAILGTTGYTGMLLARLLADHPEVDQILPVSSSKTGQKLSDVDPGFQDPKAKISDGGVLLSLEEAQKRSPEVVFSALPHLESARLCAPFLGSSVIIDLSADFRLKDPKVFQAAYGTPPPRVDLLDRAVYGLPEWHGEAIRSADLIANPGCYPTSVLLPLLPVARAGLIGGEIHVSSISGISGAGRKLKTEYLFCERSENACAYAPGKRHRHVSEMEEQLRGEAPEASILFVPHLAPLRKGMNSTIMVPLSRTCTEEEVASLFQAAYGSSPFIGLRGSAIPQTAEVRGSNRCDIGWQIEGRTLMLFSVLDNLMKGASGQAVQNMNVRMGFPETSALSLAGEI